ncbi:MAG: SIS domain-containing protein [Cyanobacteria bacterium SIG28]|nr:SIS domain-containing protein [Cyanobacteria bacterium SIG28]
MRDYIKNYIKSSIDTKSLILSDEKLLETIEKSADVIINAYKNDKKVLVAGNGGSAADAQHIAAEFVSKFFYERQALSAIALTTNTSILTSIGNDYDHKMVFARQLQAHGRKGDVFIAISTSGASKNIIKAAEYAKKCGLISIALTGLKESPLDSLADYVIKVPSKITPIIQESHIMIAHIICAMVEQSFNQ